MKWLSLAFPLVLLMDAIIAINFIFWNEKAIYEYEQRQLDIQVNYAVDAAAQEMLYNTARLYTDYADWGKFNIDPEVAWYTYKEALIRNFNWSRSQENFDNMVADNIPFFVVICYDGYYAKLKVPVQTSADGSSGTTKVTSYELRWTPKLPFTRVASDGSIRMYNLGEKQYTSFNQSTSLKVDNTMTPDELYYKQVTVSNTITELLNKALFMGTEGNTEVGMYIPPSYTEFVKTNAIETPTVLTYLDYQYGKSSQGYSIFAIGGSKIDEADFVICYEYNGKKLYTYARYRDDVEAKYGTFMTLIDVKTSAFLAAEDGYYYDLNFY